MQLQFIVALLVVLALCEGCAGMDLWKKLTLGGNDKGKSTNFTSPNSSNQPKSDDKGKGKMYSSGSDDGRQSMHQNPSDFPGFTAPTNPGTRGGSRTTHQNVSNIFEFTAPTNPGTRGGSQTTHQNVSNFGGFTAPTNPGTRGGSQTTHQNVSNFGGFTAPTNSDTDNSGGISREIFDDGSIELAHEVWRRTGGGNTPNLAVEMFRKKEEKEKRKRKRTQRISKQH